MMTAMFTKKYRLIRKIVSSFTILAVITPVFIGVPIKIKTVEAQIPNQEKVIFLTTTGTQTWTVPDDWSDDNKIEVLGAGGGGRAGSTSGSGGGGGGAYASINVTGLTPGGSVTYRVGAGGNGGTTAGTSGTAGGDTFFNRTAGSANTCADTVSVCAKGGGGATSATGAAGGAVASNKPANVGWAGGAGGSGNNTGDTGGGGGGAAGPHGIGRTGGAGQAAAPGAGGGGGANGTANGSAGSTNGGNGAANYRGTGAGTGANATTDAAAVAGTNGGGGGGGAAETVTTAIRAGANGGNGSLVWVSTHAADGTTPSVVAAGPGGGGGGAGATTGNGTGAVGGNGGTYGAGGGGSYQTAGAGAQGIIVITYVPSTVTVKTIFLTTSPGSNQTWTVPSDWSDDNEIIVLGAGGGGRAGSSAGARGGGGGAIATSTVTGLSPGGSVTYRVGAGGAGGTTAGTSGTTGGDTFFNRTAGSANTCADTVSVCAKGGTGGTSATAGGVGGSIASNKPAYAGFNGGAAGSGNNSGDTGGGGGGAASIFGAGRTGGAGQGAAPGAGGGGAGVGGLGSNGSTSGGAGGVSFAGTGGGTGANPTTNTAATAGTNGGGGGGGAATTTTTSLRAGAAGSNSAIWTQTSDDATIGPGGGGGGGGATTGVGTGSSGGNGGYGAGGGGAYQNAGNGGQGFIVIRYVPSGGTTTLGGGTDKISTTVGPGGGITEINRFSLETSAGTDTVTGMTVTLAGDASAYTNIATVDVRPTTEPNFVGLGEATRGWQGIAVNPSNNDVYATVGNGTIYKQTGGSGSFNSLAQTTRVWRGIAVNPKNNDAYAVVGNGDIYKQTGGTGDFIALGQTSRDWMSIAINSNTNDVYATVYNGNIYKQTGGTGNFVSLGQTTRNWAGITIDSENNDVYATVEGGYIYKQYGGVGDFVAFEETNRAWTGIGVDSVTKDVYAATDSGDIYKKTGGTAFVALGQTSRVWANLSVNSATHDVYTVVESGDIYKSTFPSALCSATPSSNTVALTSCGISVNTTPTEYRVTITPKSHAAMPAVPGASYPTTATVTAITATNSTAGTDTNSASVTVDNASPAGVTSATATGGDTEVDLAWTNPLGTFPTTGILDNFNRADENPLTIGWGEDYRPYHTSTLRIVGNQVNRISGSGNLEDGAYWDQSIFNADSEVYVDIVTKPSNTEALILNLRIANPGTGSVDAYGATLWPQAGTDIVRLFRIDDDVPTQLGADILQEFSNGDSLGFRMVGDTMTVYRKSGGTWSALGSRTDSTYTAGGYIGISNYTDSGAASSVVDNFGGGSIDLSGVVVLRRAGSAVADVPVEGATYSVGNTIGTATVACVINGTPPTTTCTDTGLSNGTAYHYEIFTRDSRGNYDAGTVPTGSPVTPAGAATTSLGDGTDGPNLTVGPGVSSVEIDRFSLATSAGTDTVTGMTVTLAGDSNAYTNIATVGVYPAADSDFVGLSQTTRNWWGVSIDSSDQDVYATVPNVGIFKQTGGTGNFVSVDATEIYWTGVAINQNTHDVYVGTSGGDIYKQTAGSGSFVALGQTSRAWYGIGIDSSTGDVYATVDGGDIYKQTGGTGDFVALGQTSRAWGEIAVNPVTHDVYAVVYGGDIYKQTGGTGDFVALGQATRDWNAIAVDSLTHNVYSVVWTGDIYKSTFPSALCSATPSSNNVALTSCGISVTTTPTEYRVMVTPKSHAAMPAVPGASYSTTATVTSITSTNPMVFNTFNGLSQSSLSWRGMTVTPNGDVYVAEFTPSGGIYKQTGGTGNFVTLSQTSRNWMGMTATPSGDVYATDNGGDIYKQTGGTGNFVALSQFSRPWYGLAAAPNGDVYASATGLDIYKQTGGTGNFVGLSQTLRQWTGMAAAPNGDVYAAVSGGDIYKQTGGAGDFVALNETTRNWRGIAVTPGGDVYASVDNGDIYKKLPEDLNSATITVDNASPAGVTSATATGGDTEVDLAWTNPADSDFTTNGTIVVLRRAGSAVADVPVEGATYSVGNTIGTATVACVINGTPPTTTCTDTGLSNGTAYHYEIFTRDSRGNYDAGTVPTGSPVTPGGAGSTITQLHFRWRNDDSTEANASFVKEEDSPITTINNINIGDRRRLRIMVQNTDGSTATNYQYRLEHSSSSCTVWLPVPNTESGGTHFVMDLSTKVFNGSATTNLGGITDPGLGSFVSGFVQTSSNQTSPITLPLNGFTELEYSIRSTSNAVTGLNYCFRVTNAGDDSEMVYPVTPQITLSSYKRNGNVPEYEVSGTGILVTGGGYGGGGGSESSGTLVFSSNFTAPNGTGVTSVSPEVGPNMDLEVGTALVQNNRLYATVDQTSVEIPYSMEDSIVSATIRRLSSAQGFRLFSRATPNSGYYASVSQTSGIRLYKIVISPFNNPQLGATYDFDASLNTDYLLELVTEGDQISVKLNGQVIIGPVTDTELTSGNTAIGWYNGGSSTTGWHVDSLEVREILPIVGGADGIAHRSTFTASNNTLVQNITPDTGLNLSSELGEMMVVNNRLYPNDTASAFEAQENYTSPNYIVRTTWRKISATGNEHIIYGRNFDAGDNSYYVVMSDTVLELEKNIGGSYTNLGNYSISTSNGNDYEVELVMNGNQISVKYQGNTVIGPVTDNSHTQAGTPAVYWIQGGSSSTGWHLDTFEAQYIQGGTGGGAGGGGGGLE